MGLTNRVDKVVAHSLQVKLAPFCLLSLPDWERALYFHVLGLKMETPVTPCVSTEIGASCRTETIWEELRKGATILTGVNANTFNKT